MQASAPLPSAKPQWLGVTFGGLKAAKESLLNLRAARKNIDKEGSEADRLVVFLCEKRLRQLVRYLVRRVHRFYPQVSEAFESRKGGAA